MTREELRAYIDAAIGLLKLIVAIVPKLAPVITLLEWVKDKDVLLDLILRFFNRGALSVSAEDLEAEAQQLRS